MVIDSKSHTNGGGQVSVIVFKWESKDSGI